MTKTCEGCEFHTVMKFRVMLGRPDLRPEHRCKHPDVRVTVPVINSAFIRYHRELEPCERPAWCPLEKESV